VGAATRETALLRQQATLANFGEFALRADDLDKVLHEACRLLGDALHTDLAKVMELQEDGVTLLVRAGVGWPPGIVGKATARAEKGSSEGYALQTGNPAASSNIDTEDRFTYAEFVKQAGVKALVNVVIIGAEDKPPYGILQVDSRHPREFTEGDINFLRTYANLLAAAVDRLRMTEDQLRAHDALAAPARSWKDGLPSAPRNWNGRSAPCGARAGSASRPRNGFARAKI